MPELGELEGISERMSALGRGLGEVRQELAAGEFADPGLIGVLERGFALMYGLAAEVERAVDLLAAEERSMDSAREHRDELGL